MQVKMEAANQELSFVATAFEKLKREILEHIRHITIENRILKMWLVDGETLTAVTLQLNQTSRISEFWI